jgi:hypothetical protein
MLIFCEAFAAQPAEQHGSLGNIPNHSKPQQTQTLQGMLACAALHAGVGFCCILSAEVLQTVCTLCKAQPAAYDARMPCIHQLIGGVVDFIVCLVVHSRSAQPLSRHVVKCCIVTVSLLMTAPNVTLPTRDWADMPCQ